MLRKQGYTNCLRQFLFRTRCFNVNSQASFSNPKNSMTINFKYNYIESIIHFFRRFPIFFRPGFLVLNGIPFQTTFNLSHRFYNNLAKHNSRSPDVQFKELAIGEPEARRKHHMRYDR